MKMQEFVLRVMFSVAFEQMDDSQNFQRQKFLFYIKGLKKNPG